MDETNRKKKTIKERRPVEKFVKFLIHLLFVVAILIAGSFIFIEIEEKRDDIKSQKVDTEEEFLQKLIFKYNFTIPVNERTKVMKELNSYFKSQRLASQQNKTKSTNYELFLKWFHFSNIAATTIGEFCTFIEQFLNKPCLKHISTIYGYTQGLFLVM